MSEIQTLKLKDYYAKLLSSGLVIFCIGIICVILANLLFSDWVTEFTALYRLGGALFLLALYDKYILVDYDIIDEIFAKKNKAVAIFFSMLIFTLAFIAKG